MPRCPICGKERDEGDFLGFFVFGSGVTMRRGVCLECWARQKAQKLRSKGKQVLFLVREDGFVVDCGSVIYPRWEKKLQSG
ncbi:MAG: hypothetical protein QW687_01540, partial [Candidatus Hadarchaeales archaeon]